MEAAERAKQDLPPLRATTLPQAGVARPQLVQNALPIKLRHGLDLSRVQTTFVVLAGFDRTPGPDPTFIPMGGPKTHGNSKHPA